ncbi:MAG: D-xylose transport system substrate-binding protein [Clostridiales bacterium]|nr:D-xylose transport system substrate-binding protein [Clostridiales bacterium]
MRRGGSLLAGIGMLLITFTLAGCKGNNQIHSTTKESEVNKVQIGLSWDTFVLERWIRDRDVFVSTATELGAEVNVQNANGDFEEQLAQIEYLINKKMDVIVIVAVDTNSDRLVKLIKKAQDQGIKIISYDRLICNAGTDLYLSFDNKQVGRLMAQAVVDQIPEGGRIAAIFGPLTDHNVVEIESGVQEVLKENNQKLVYRNYAKNWQAEYAQEYMNECIVANGGVDGVICGNDGLAAGAYRALAERRLAAKVCLVGQDADIDACQRIVEGNQYMTVYKAIMDLAKQAAGYAVSLAKNEKLEALDSINDGSYYIPYYKLEPVAVTKENMDSVIIDSQFHFKDEVYLHVEESQ